MATITLSNFSNDSAIIPSFPGAAVAITPSDADSFSVPVSVYVGVTGNVAVRPANGGSAVTFVGVPAGAVLPVRVIGVNSTSTTATNLVAVY